MTYILPDLNILKTSREISPDRREGRFIIEPLSPGYGVTIGNTLRRILLSSLEGCAVKSVKIAGANHEFSSLKGIREDAVDIILNLKTARFKILTGDQAALEISVKGPKNITCGDFKKSSNAEPLDADHYIARVEKGGKLEMEINLSRGRGYVPLEKQQDEKKPLGTILVDCIYTPVKKVHFEVENTRVGSVTNYDKLTLDITTDGSVSASEALGTAANIMIEHLSVISESTKEVKAEKEKKVGKIKVKPRAKAKK